MITFYTFQYVGKMEVKRIYKSGKCLFLFPKLYTFSVVSIDSLGTRRNTGIAL